jgi:cytochrome c-type biogenesis protein
VSEFLLAYAAGLVVLLNPCVLPVLPILIGSALNEGRYGPAALTAGLVLSFCLFGFLILTVGFEIGLEQETARRAAAILLLAVGLLLLSTRAQAAFARLATPLASGGQTVLNRLTGRGLTGQFAIGLLLGLVWAPCVGPVLGVAIASASQGENLAEAFATFLVFGAGVASILLAFAYASRGLLALRSGGLRGAAQWSKPLLGGILVVVGLAILTGLDKAAETSILAVMPQWLIDFTVRF